MSPGAVPELDGAFESDEDPFGFSCLGLDNENVNQTLPSSQRLQDTMSPPLPLLGYLTLILQKLSPVIAVVQSMPAGLHSASLLLSVVLIHKPSLPLQCSSLEGKWNFKSPLFRPQVRQLGLTNLLLSTKVC